jgi:hypothetical protein
MPDIILPATQRDLNFRQRNFCVIKENGFKIVRENKITENEEYASRKSISQLQHKPKIQKKDLKELIDRKSVKENFVISYYIYNPSHIFITLKVVVRFVDDILYPNFYPDSDTIDECLIMDT